MHPRPSRLPAASALAGALLLALALLLCGATLARAESGPLFPEEKSGAKSGQSAPPTATRVPNNATVTTSSGAVAHIHESATLPPASARTSAPAATGTAAGTGATPATGSAPATAAPPPTATTPATATPGTASPPAGTSAAPPASATQLPAPHAATTAAAAKHKASGKTRPSDLAIALAALAALLVLGVLAWGIARWNAWEPAWLLSLRHAFAEGGYHTSAGMAELRDWARLGR